MAMMKRKTLDGIRFVILYLALILVCVALDQVTKIGIFDILLQGTTGKSVDVLGKFLRFYALYNEGAAFGFGQDDGANILFFVITVVGVPLFGWLLWRSRNRSVCGQIGFAFVIGGTIGNAIDRACIKTTDGLFFSGKVRDFISFSIFPPVFNVADSFLVIGVLMAVLAIVFFDYDGLVPTIRKEKSSKAIDGGASEKADKKSAEGDDEACKGTDKNSVNDDSESKAAISDLSEHGAENPKKSDNGGSNNSGTKSDAVDGNEKN